MITLLSKLFIKDYNNYSDTRVREKYGIVCSLLGIFLNIVLFAAKLAGSLIAKSVSMTADAFNNLSDAASSFISVLGFKLSGKKPDADHPFGHGRLEYISGLIVSFLIIFMGIELFRSSADSIIHPKTVEGGIIPAVIMVLSIAVKFYMYLYNHFTAKKIKSPTMEAVARDSFGDMIATSVVIISVIASRFTAFPVDGAGGIIVAAFIIKSGFDSCMETVNPLLGQPPEREFVSEIEAEVLKFNPIFAIHDLVVHDYGPGRLMISLHAEVPGDRNIFELHDVIDNAEVSLAMKFNCAAVIHMDPIDTNNARLDDLKNIAVEESKKLDSRFTIHDVRMIPGDTHTNLIFDLVRPHDCRYSETEIKTRLFQAINQREKAVYTVVTVESPFIR